MTAYLRASETSGKAPAVVPLVVRGDGFGDGGIKWEVLDHAGTDQRVLLVCGEGFGLGDRQQPYVVYRSREADRLDLR